MNEIVVSWSGLLSKKLGRPAEEIAEKGLSGYDFSPSKRVEIEFSDKSHCLFKYSFAVINEQTRQVAVFTEHCGYHVYSTYGAVIKEINEDIFVDDDYEP
ncbi:MAG: hypothetical protein H6998_00110 [Hahellaceae bacterium]|nr:hypothetical protein [Hahellaceae bacterium]